MYKRYMAWIFILAAVIRVGLVVVNWEANDDHMRVIKIFMNEHRVPQREDCWEGFQPKLYHATCAAVLSVLPTESLSIQIRVAQMISCMAGLITLYAIYLFLLKLPYPDKLKLLCFGLIALNPKFAGINAQVTNDSFVIMFATLCLYNAYYFFSKWDKWNLVWMIIFSILASLSKGSAVVIAILIVCMFLFKIVHPLASRSVRRSYYLLGLTVYISVFMLIVPFFGQYWNHYKRFGSPFVTGINKGELPHFIEKTDTARPGVTSIVDSYCTFRFIDMLKTPTVLVGNVGYPKHRTSVWSQLYGNTYFVHFTQWPPTWVSEGGTVLWVGRFILILALLPTIYLLIGAWRGLCSFISCYLLNRRRQNCYDEQVLLTVGAFAYIAFFVVFTMTYRSFEVMKAIFLFPGLLCGCYLIIDGMSFVYNKFATRMRIIHILDSVLISLFVFFYVDLFILTYHLAV